MAQYQSLNANLLHLRLNKSTLATKNAPDLTLRLSSNMFGTNKTNFARKLLSNDTQVSHLRKTFLQIIHQLI